MQICLRWPMGASSFLLLSSVQHVCVRYFSWCSDQTPDPLSPQKILRKARFILAYGLGGNIVCHIGEGRNTGAKPASDITSEGRKQIAVKVGWRSAHFLLLVLNSSPGAGGGGGGMVQPTFRLLLLPQFSLLGNPLPDTPRGQFPW